MRKLGLITVLSVGLLWLSPFCEAEVVDDFANALCQLSGSCKGTFSGGKKVKVGEDDEEEGPGRPGSKWEALSVLLGKKWMLLKEATALEDAKKTTKSGMSAGDLTNEIGEILSKMVENVESRWGDFDKKKGSMGSAELVGVQSTLMEETIHTIMFSVESTAYGVIKTMRSIVQFPLRVEELAHLVPLFEYAAKVLMDSKYQERLRKMQILVKCIALGNEKKREAAAMGGKNVCKEVDCVKLDRCARQIVANSIYLLQPLVETFVTGVTIGGRKFDGGILTALRIVAPEDTIDDIKKAVDVLKLLMHLLEQMDKMLAQNAKK